MRCFLCKKDYPDVKTEILSCEACRKKWKKAREYTGPEPDHDEESYCKYRCELALKRKKHKDNLDNSLK